MGLLFDSDMLVPCALEISLSRGHFRILPSLRFWTVDWTPLFLAQLRGQRPPTLLLHPPDYRDTLTPCSRVSCLITYIPPGTGTFSRIMCQWARTSIRIQVDPMIIMIMAYLQLDRTKLHSTSMYYSWPQIYDRYVGQVTATSSIHVVPSVRITFRHTVDRLQRRQLAMASK